MSAAPFLDIEGITVRFGGLTAVNNLSFQVQQGTIHALIGPNGAGKSTTFNCISRYYQPTAGRIRIAGEDVTAYRPARMAGLGVARTFQNLELFGELSVHENVLLGCHAHSANTLGTLLRRPSGETRDLVDSLIERVGLTHDRNTRANELDFGHQKLLELARALCTEPQLLLLDEPSSGLNVEETDDMAFWISDIKNELGITVLMVEHDMSLVSKVSDRVLAMSQGEELATGTPSQVQSDPGVIEAYLGSVDDVSALRRENYVPGGAA